MTYFIALGGLMAVLGLAAASVSQDPGFTAFGWGMFVFGALFALFLVKRHYDMQDGSGRP